MSGNTYIQIEDDDDDVVDINAGQFGGDAVATIETTPVWSEDVDGFDFFTPDLNLPASELDTSTVSNMKNHPSRSRTFFGDGSDPEPDGGNQVSFVMDLFGQRIELSGIDPDPNPNIGIVEDEDVPMDNNLEMGLVDQQSDSDFGYVDDDVDGYSGIFCANCGDEFLDSGTMSDVGDPLDLIEHDFFMGDLEIESDSGQRGDGVMDDFALGDDNVNDFAFSDDIVIDDQSLPIYLTDNVDVNNNHDFEWEEIGGTVDELSMFFQGEADVDDNVSVVPESGGVSGRETNETMANLEWEVLLNIHNLEMSKQALFESEGSDSLPFQAIMYAI
ncbi:E3 ubiquitin-protein like [Heracleum sosnowskyi]|uniref:E3 ubiquitin-protein like n=1 Tax=Heracleum sosnowskyi TaxID=360622 RepID=A0AAD8MT85_9APIA|nr:E3 ubiquitin-protein like [Heracleum sosnowskyi]